MTSRSRSFDNLFSRSLKTQPFQTPFPQIPLGWLFPNFTWSFLRCEKCIFSFQIFQVTSSTWHVFPCMVKLLKHIPLRIPEADNHETWYTVSGAQVLPNVFKWWSWTDLDHFLFFLVTGSDLFPNASVRPEAYTALTVHAFSSVFWFSRWVLQDQWSATGPIVLCFYPYLYVYFEYTKVVEELLALPHQLLKRNYYVWNPGWAGGGGGADPAPTRRLFSLLRPQLYLVGNQKHGT